MRRAVLTHKEPAADTASDSKPEHGTKVADATVVDEILRALGLEHLIAFEKHCANYRFTAKARDMLATVVTVPEIGVTVCGVLEDLRGRRNLRHWRQQARKRTVDAATTLTAQETYVARLAE